jgi:hypothetical protein
VGSAEAGWPTPQAAESVAGAARDASPGGTGSLIMACICRCRTWLVPGCRASAGPAGELAHLVRTQIAVDAVEGLVEIVGAHPASFRSAVIRGDPYVPLCTLNSRAISAASAARRWVTRHPLVEPRVR